MICEKECEQTSKIVRSVIFFKTMVVKVRVNFHSKYKVKNPYFSARVLNL